MAQTVVEDIEIMTELITVGDANLKFRVERTITRRCKSNLKGHRRDNCALEVLNDKKKKESLEVDGDPLPVEGEEKVGQVAPHTKIGKEVEKHNEWETYGRK